MSAYGDDQIGRVLGARYRLLTPVGSGASATVYQADDVQLRRTVAVKLLHPTLASDPTFLKRFRAEAQAAAGLSHPNVMAVFDWGEDHGTPYLVLEYLAGGSLRAMLDVGRRLTPSQTLVVGLEAARGLDYAHKRGVVHRDIKPANLLFGEDGRLRIADFGLARAISEASWTEPDGVMLGTARYASPEQATGQPLDGKSDVYSLALSLVEAVTGQVPFAAETTVATLMARLGKLLPVSADLGPLAPVLERAGRPHPEERYDSAELGRALLATAERLSRPAPLPLVVTLPPKRQDETALGMPILPLGADGTIAVPTVGLAGSPAAPAGVGATLIGAAAVGNTRVPSDVQPDSGAVPQVESPPVVSRGIESRQPGGLGEPPVISARVSGIERETDDQPPPEEYIGLQSNHVDDSEAIAALALKAPRKRRAGRAVLWVVMLALLLGVAGGVVALVKTAGKVKSHPLPSVVGLSEGTARNNLSPLELIVTVRLEKSDLVPAPGTVIAQQPETGLMVKKGDEVVLAVSDGPTLRKLRDVSKLPAAEAKSLLESDKLVYREADKIFDETDAAGIVMKWTVEGKTLAVGSEVAQGTIIDVVLSQGPTPRHVPEIRSMTWDQARAAIENVQLKAVRQEDIFSDKWNAGIVARIEPGIETEMARGSEVKIWISKGPDVVEVPNIYADSLDKAVELIKAAGLVQGTIDGPIDRPVIAQDPTPGTKVKRGSVVKIRLG